jgi:hypothetical protein
MITSKKELMNYVQVGDELQVVKGKYTGKTAQFQSWPEKGKRAKVNVVIDSQLRQIPVKSVDFDSLYNSKGLVGTEHLLRNNSQPSILHWISRKHAVPSEPTRVIEMAEVVKELAELRDSLAELQKTVEELKRYVFN